ncbi:ComEC/Rec2 family competence protein [Anaplasma centrale]|uniref:ComEC/Rec2 family competence protein n=1 Tax=Anaplasma centrale TaxID=769 RepID=UPI001EE58BD9|nr:ComEC/Rec2 family competence protein [Anaplasma centrale]
MVWIPALQAAGILLYFSLKHEPGFVLAALVACAALILFLLTLVERRLLPIILAFGALGFVSAYCRTSLLFSKRPPTATFRRTYVSNATGVLKEINHKPRYIQLLVCNVTSDRIQGICARLAVRTAIDPTIRPGDILTFSGVMHPPLISASKHGYDFARVAYFRGIDAVGFTTSQVKLHERRSGVGLKERVERVRDRIYARLVSGLQRDCAEIMAALLVGKRLGIRDEILADIRNSGLSHLFAISGLHLSFVAGIFFMLTRNIFVLSETITLKYNIKKFAAVAAVIASFLYLLVSGMPVSACRAFIMVTLTFVGIMIDKPNNGLRSISLAAFIILLFTPEAILLPSFQMSFAAVIALAASCDVSKVISACSVVRYITAAAAGSLIASIATAPYVVYHFNYFSVVGVISNIVAIPLTAFVVIPLGLVYVVMDYLSIGSLVSRVLEMSVGLILCVARYGAKVEWLAPTVRSIPPSAVLLMTLGLLAFSWGRGTLRIVSGLLFTLSGLLLAITYKTPDILFGINGVAVKEGDGKLHFAMRKGNSARGFAYSAWARENGQTRIVNEEYFGRGKKLICVAGGCTYGSRVLISCDTEFIVQHCSEADLVIHTQLGVHYPSLCSHVPHISYDDVKERGAHYVSFSGSSIKVESARTGRPWHINAAGFVQEKKCTKCIAGGKNVRRATSFCDSTATEPQSTR